MTMRLRAKLDAFKADFEVGKPPYNVSRSVVETMHRATAAPSAVMVRETHTLKARRPHAYVG
jgi:hypothetical protein